MPAGDPSSFSGLALTTSRACLFEIIGQELVRYKDELWPLSSRGSENPPPFAGSIRGAEQLDAIGDLEQLIDRRDLFENALKGAKAIRPVAHLHWADKNLVFRVAALAERSANGGL